MAEYLVENARLRQLSRQYAEEQLPFDDYREARRLMLTALEAGEVQNAGAADLMPEAPVSRAPQSSVGLPDDAAVFYKTMPPHGPVTDTPEERSLVWDDNTQVLALVLVLSMLIALGALVYVFIL